MKTYRRFLFLCLFAFILSACSNIPQVPTKTPTMSPDDMMTAAVSTAESLRRETETQWAIDNPSPTPTDTATPTPEATPTSALPLIPPTATEKALAYFNIDNKSSLVRENGNPSNYSDFVPSTNLYIEICYQNNGSGTWTDGYYCMMTNANGANITTRDPIYLRKTVQNGEWACFSFDCPGSYNYALKTYCPSFQLYTDSGVAIRNGNNSACFTIH